MRPRSLALAALALLLALPLAAFDRGDVLLEDRATAPSIGIDITYELWQHADGGPYALAYGTSLLSKFVPLAGPGHVLAPAPDRFLFVHDHTVAWWDGVNHFYLEPGVGYTDIFTDDADLGDIAPMRSGHYLVPERQRPNVIEFDLNGRIAAYALPEASGPEYIELLADQCTLLYSMNDRVRRYDLCTRQAASDFATLQAGQSAGAIRQLPDGDVLVAAGNAVLQFDANGGLLRSYPFPGVTNLALTQDGSAFWAAGVDAGHEELRRYDVRTGAQTPVAIGNPEMTTAFVPVAVTDLVVVGEWRAAAPPRVRLRAVH